MAAQGHIHLEHRQSLSALPSPSPDNPRALPQDYTVASASRELLSQQLVQIQALV